MKKRTLWLDTIREIKRSKNRFISILLIVLLGAGFFVGVKATAPSIRASAENYFNLGNMLDLKILSSVGFSDDDIKEIIKIDGVKDVMPSYSLDVTLANDSLTAIKIASIPEEYENSSKINVVTLTEGRMPSGDGECIVANNRFMGNSYKIGDRIAISETVGDTDVTDYLNVLEYTVVGFFDTPLYFSYSYETTSVGNGTVSTVIYVPESEFSYFRYTEAYVTIERDGITAFDEEYEEKLNSVSEAIKSMSGGRLEIFRTEYSEKLADAENELIANRKEAQEKLDDAKAELDSAKTELDDAIAKLTEGWAEFNSQKNEALSTLSDAEKELLDGKAELEENKNKLSDAETQYSEAESKFNSEFANAKKKLNSAKLELDKAKKEYNNYLAEYESALAEYNSKKSEYDKGLEDYNKGKKDYEKGKSEYEKGLASYNDGLKKYNEGLAEYNSGLAEYQKNYNELKPYLDQYSEGLEKYNKGLAEYEAGKAEYDENKELFDQSQAEYDAAYKEYSENLAAYNTAVSQLPVLKQILTESEYNALVLQLEAAKKELESAKKQLDAAKKELEAGKRELDAAEKKLKEAKAELDSSKAELDSAWAELEKPSKELDAAKATLDSSNKKLTDTKKQLDDAKTTLDKSKIELDSAEKELSEGKAKLDEAKPQLDSAEKELNMAKKELSDAKKELDKGEAEYNSGLAEYDSEYKKAESELLRSKKEIDEAKTKLADAESEIAIKEAELNEAKAEIDLEFADAESELNNAQSEVDKGQAEYNEGLEEYNSSVAEFETEISKAEADIDSLRTLIDSTEDGSWYAMKRNDVVTQYQSLCDDCGRLDAIVNIFPVFFLAVACLVCLTTMTRMVDEQRTQMGTYKALGYSGADIKKKFLVYALSASIIGGIIGIAVCVQILPRVIYGAYNVLYLFGKFDIVIPWDMAALSLIVSVLCITVITEICCRRELKVTTAALMRPKSPKAGKKIFLEKIGFFWNRLGFSMKVTLRNLFRYKMRLAMTVVGISGCMMLMVAGFGLQNSILAIVDKQYGVIYAYDIEAYPLESQDPESAARIVEKTLEYDFTDKAAMTLQTAISVSNGEKTHSEDISLYVPDESGNIDNLLFLYPVGTDISHSEESVSPIKISDDGVIVTEKLSKILDIDAGDEITVTLNENDYTVRVDGICKNYVLHNVYMSSEYYRNVIGDSEPLVYNRLEVTVVEGTDHDEAIAAILSDIDEVSYAGSLSAAGDLLGDMIEGLNMVVIVMILCAGALAFLVVYNLTNINISERIREIATIKVLGFKKLETNMYVFRENLIMCIASILFGSVLGYYLAQFMIETVEVNMTMFERILPPSGFIYSALLTFAFTLMVSLFMTKRVKSVSMVESLKAIE